MSVSSTSPASSYVRNRILRCLRSEDLQKFLSRLETVTLPLHTILHRPEQVIDYVYFVESGTISMIAALEDGTEAEVGLVGREGVVGIALALGARTSDLEALVQVAGEARRIPADAFRVALSSVPSLRDVILPYVNVFHFQVARTAACNSRHRIEQRLCRWLLMTSDRTETDQFPMTPAFMSRMLGVRRPSVNLAVRTLQRAGLIETGPGWLKILDRAAMDATACECYAAVRRRFLALDDYH